MKLLPARVAAAAIVALIAGALTAIPASAATVSVTIDGVTYTADDSNVAAGATVTTYTQVGTVTAIDIEPQVVIGGDTYAVTTIGDHVFQAKGLTAVTIPENVITIGAFAFDGNHLTTVTIPDSVITIGSAAFYRSSITGLTLGTGLTSIGTSAFLGTRLASLTVPDSVTTIGGYAFADNLLTSLTIGSGITSIEGSVFRGNQLTTVEVPNNVTTIGDYAFINNLLTSVTLPDSVTSIGYAAFNSNRLTSFTIPGSVISLGDYSFNGNQLTSVTFDGNAPSIGISALGVVTQTNDPLVGFYSRNSGFTAPSWVAGEVRYRSQALATVTFDANGHGTTPAAVNVVVDDTVAEPADPTETGYTFDGWFDAATGGNAFAFATPITEDLTLFAQWSEVVPDPTPTPTPSPTATPSPSATAAADTEVAVAAGEELADTGATNTGLIWTAGLLLALGATALALRARRTHK
ncbi:leucine-rich repeat protein [Demequina aurantiaca]|uniref:leucine-rich repeat protein n=1 Tax=Demequina aurantiaca TaxID=676200 RepID=UPI003D34D736